jgi:hypothetical protein
MSQIVQLKDRTGNILSLNVDDIITLRARENWDSTGAALVNVGEITSAVDGKVKFEIVATSVPAPGLYLGEIVIDHGTSSSSSSASFVSDYRAFCYVEAEAGLKVRNAAISALSIAEVRMAIRDKCAVDNFLLDRVEFTDGEIAWSMRRPIDFWNEVPPPITQIFTPITFPYRYFYLNGVIGELLQIAAVHYERNTLRYTAAGMAVADKDKAKFYTEAAQKFQNEFRVWCRQQKKTINLSECYGGTALPSFGGGVYRNWQDLITG